MSIETSTTRVPTWTLGELLRKARTDAGLSQDEMAVELGVSRRTVTYWETDHIVPRRAMVLAWALRTSVPVWWLEGSSGPTGPTGPDQGRRVTGRSLVQVQPRERMAPVRVLRTGASSCPERAA